ncbi:MacB family efflux pump subunit [Aquabacter spiritensis]|uniref:Macrolide transport system ATP-binding/permease protein n=1 Tax=Aquabacter spiritensis TaxID=933073 RepID=A0A4R3M5C0_9HYPH|nr:MacB family efflux pump subunit [Aquabacter spiritensis]TCT08222.1 macrolide transport system ATP-binding/permease protein [Aquabacter spiritensis]
MSLAEARGAPERVAQDTRQPLLDIAHVSKIYPSGDSVVRALDDVSIRIMPGEYVAIMGQSGSGKSTLMNIMGCLDRPSLGTYRVLGRDIATLDADDLASLRCRTFGFVFQRYNLLPAITAEENVEIPAIYAGRPKAERVSRARALLGRLGLADRAGHRPSQLSGGQQQRVSIARALMNEAPVILADEPTGALDSHSGAEVLALLAELNREGRTILLITHDPEVAAHARRIVRLQDGRVVSDQVNGDPAETPPAPPVASTLKVRNNFLSDLGEAVKMAFRSMRANLFRTVLTLLGVIIGVAAVIAMLGIGQGSKQSVLDRIASMGTNLLVVRPGAPGIRSTGSNASLSLEDAQAIADEVPNVLAVSPERSTGATVRVGNIDYATTIQGASPGYTAARDLAMADGTMFTERDVEGYAPVVVLGRTVARVMFPDGRSPVGRYVLIKNVPYEVAGVLAPRGANAFGMDQDDIVLMPITTGFMRVFGRRFLSAATVAVEDPDRIDETQEAIAVLLRQRHRAEDFQIRNTSSILEMATATADTLTRLLGFVAAISLVVGGIGVMNIMLVSVTERTREIGIRMATGARRANIMLQFNTEALVICGAGGLVGVGFGLGTALLLKSFGSLVILTPGPPLLAFGCAFLTGIVFGYLPARKAAGLDPVAALAYE